MKVRKANHKSLQAQLKSKEEDRLLRLLLAYQNTFVVKWKEINPDFLFSEHKLKLIYENEEISFYFTRIN